MRAAKAVLGTFAAALGLAGGAAAEAVLDGTTGSTGSFSGDFDIPAAVGRLEGANLFHSFLRFHVQNGESATFTGPAGIANVISRVTGGEASTIDGALASTVPGADFYFFNPAGVMVGPDASINVPGAFHLSTAEELRFADGTRFSATDPGASSFSMASPEAFGFLGAPGDLTVDRGTLQTAFGQTLSLSAGSITVDGGGNGFVSAGSGGLIGATDGGLHVAALTSGSFAPATGETSSAQGGAITLADEASLTALGLGNGAVRVTGARLEVGEGSSVQSINLGAGNNGNGIRIEAGEVVVLEEGTILSSARDAGAGGPIDIDGGDLTVDGGSIESDSFAAGDAGDIDIDADRVEVGGGRGILSSTLAIATGDGADIDITASSILVDRATIDLTRFGTGAAGDLRIEAGDVTLRGATFGIAAFNPTSGASSRIRIIADSLTVDAAGILSNTLADGTGGALVIDAGQFDIINAGLVSTASLASGDAGPIDITTDRLTIAGLGGGLLVDSIDTAETGGDGGTMTIDAGSILVRDGGSISSETSGGGNSGRIDITATGDVVLRDGGQIRASSSGSGRPGDITMEVGRLELSDAGTVSSAAIGATVGDDVEPAVIRITATGGIEVEGTEDRISGFTTLTTGPRDAGTIQIDTSSLVLSGTTLLSSSTLGTGDAGAIRLTVDRLVVGPGGVVDSASPNFDQPESTGAGGEVVIVATGSVTVSGDGDAVGRITTSTATAGDAGEITIEAPLVQLEGGARVSSGTSATGDGGRVRIEGGRITLTGASSIETRSTGTSPDAGVAGGIRLVADEALTLRGGSSVSAETAVAEAGDIVIRVGELVELRSSSITTSVAGGTGSGGNIDIDPDFVILDDSRIVANAREGAGGNITIVAGTFLTTPDSTVDASSDLGIDGTVDIDAPDLDLTSELAVLSTAFVDVSRLLRDSCAARGSEATSTLTAAGGRALSPDPAAPLAGRYGERGDPEPAPAAFHRWSLAGRGGCHG